MTGQLALLEVAPVPALEGDVYIGGCRSCDRGCRGPRGPWVPDSDHALEPGAVYFVGNHGAHALCPDHGLFKVHKLEGEHRPEVFCDARCMGARGPSCSCSCGGRNHGAGWGRL